MEEGEIAGGRWRSEDGKGWQAGVDRKGRERGGMEVRGGERGGSWARGGDDRRGWQCCDLAAAAAAAAGRLHADE